MIRYFVLALAMVALILPACGSDDNRPVDPDPTVDTGFKSLSQPGHVLINLERSYNERNIVEYERLLDPDVFTFFFSDADAGAGRTPEFWGREDEIAATGRMFDPNYNGENRILSIELTLNLDGPQWVETPREAFPDEEWLSIVVPYDYVIQAEPDLTWITSGVTRTSFTVRNIGDEENPQWRLVEWRDLGSD